MDGAEKRGRGVTGRALIIYRHICIYIYICVLCLSLSLSPSLSRRPRVYPQGPKSCIDSIGYLEKSLSSRNYQEETERQRDTTRSLLSIRCRVQGLSFEDWRIWF